MAKRCRTRSSRRSRPPSSRARWPGQQDFRTRAGPHPWRQPWPAAQALHRLEGQRLLVRVPHAGARVVSLSQQELCELYEIRESLEGMACRLAAERMPAAEVQELRRVLEAHERDEAFRRAWATTSRRATTTSTIASSRAAATRCCFACCATSSISSRACTVSSTRPRPTAPGDPAEHHRILDAIADRDGELAELLMRRHIRASRLNIEQQIAQGNLRRTEA